MVTPNFKDGHEVALTARSENGLGMIAESLGGFAGTEYDSEAKGATYQLARTASGWETTAIAPPSSLFAAQEFLAASPELSSTIWRARTPAESAVAENYYIRDAAGTMTRIGSTIPPAAAAGPPSGEFQSFPFKAQNVPYDDASDDLSHVLFTIQRSGKSGLLWPGDATVGDGVSLYEYAGTGQTRPEIVGVNNLGQQISTCETWLGSLESEDVYNAMSADGSTVFFTAMAPNKCSEASSGPEVNELYARLDGVETAAISEPPGGACGVCDESERKPAAFAGASEDGSKVFFMTEQKLLGGAEGMNLYEYDFDAAAGEHVILASAGGAPAGVRGVARVSEDGSHVYFVARGRLGVGPRGGPGGSCIAEISAGEQAEEAIVEAKEQKGEPVPVNTGGKCRPKEEAENLYVFQRDAAYPTGHVSFIATLCTGEHSSGGNSGVAQCPSFRSDGSDWAAPDERPVQATPDGRFLVFRSAGDLTAGDTSTRRQVFMYDAVTGELVEVSKERSGYTPAAGLSTTENEAAVTEPLYSKATTPTASDSSLAVSNDGSVVVFASTAALTPEAAVPAAAKVESVYEYESPVADGGAISEGGVYLLSGERTATVEGTEGLGVDPSGQDVVFFTAEALVPQDMNTAFDAYDARVDGGFPAPDPPAGCVAEACQEPLLVASLSAPASTTVGTPGALSSPGGSGVMPVRRGGVVVLSRGERLARALRACARVRARRRRVACEAAALKRYAPPRAKRGRPARESK